MKGTYQTTLLFANVIQCFVVHLIEGLFPLCGHYSTPCYGSLYIPNFDEV